MPPKSKDAPVKKPPTQIVRPPISDSSLVFVPEDAVNGYQERIEKGIDWTLIEKAARHQKALALKTYLPPVTFAEALQSKINKSILRGFFDDTSTVSLEDQWELLLPITLWDIEKFSNDEGKVCFENNNCLCDNLVKLIQKAVKIGNRDILMEELKSGPVLRVNDSKMTCLDKSLLEFKNLITLNLCGNYLSEFDGRVLPAKLTSLELQANKITCISSFVEHLPAELLYLGLARNLLTNEFIEPLGRLPNQLTVLDLSDNDIYHLEPLLDALSKLPNLQALQLAGNPCAVCCGYARTTLTKLPFLKWLDCREILPSDCSVDPFDPHPDDLRSAYFTFTIFRIMSAPQPPKPDKGAVTTFHVELELPLLDTARRKFLLYRNNESLTELLLPPEDEEWSEKTPSVHTHTESKGLIDTESSPGPSDIYNHLTAKNSRLIVHYTIFESNRVQWNKLMNFQEPTIKIFCPDLVALRNTFRSVITLRLIYSVTMMTKQGKDKKSSHSIKPPSEYRVTLATIKCALRQPDWSHASQHFHWDDSLGTPDAIHWGDGDLSVLQYSQAPVKVTKGKQDTETAPSRQQPPENLTCHFGFGIDTLKL